MSTALFSFKDAVHDHLTIGFVPGCVACAQTQADLTLSAKAARSMNDGAGLATKAVIVNALESTAHEPAPEVHVLVA